MNQDPQHERHFYNANEPYLYLSDSFTYWNQFAFVVATPKLFFSILNSSFYHLTLVVFWRRHQCDHWCEFCMHVHKLHNRCKFKLFRCTTAILNQKNHLELSVRVINTEMLWGTKRIVCMIQCQSTKLTNELNEPADATVKYGQFYVS